MFGIVNQNLKSVLGSLCAKGLIGLRKLAGLKWPRNRYATSLSFLSI